MKIHTRFVVTLALCCSGMFGQTVTSSLVGTVVDPTDAAVAGAPATLTSTDTGAIRTAKTDNTGTYRFPDVLAGTYDLTVHASGFKSETQTGIVITAQEIHNGGTMKLEIGSVSDSISVTAEAAQIDLASGAKAETVDGQELLDVTLKGRDLFGFIKLVPGVLDTTASRDVTSPGSVGGLTINGNSSAHNFTVDGITDLDTGSNGSVDYEPNMDAIQELKVLTSNYAAEYGRNSGGTISVVTKSGTQNFHGSAAWNHRHEEFNADSWVNNHTVVNGVATPRTRYRYNIETYSIGGPVFIPRKFNADRRKLFFFLSQEFTGQFVTGGTETKYTPTTLEREGNFSQTFNNNGTLLVVGDPLQVAALGSNCTLTSTASCFPGNIIPPSRINPIGQAMLNYFPLPNYTPTLPAQLNVVNYFDTQSISHPRRNTVARVDYNITPKLTAYGRWISDYDDRLQLYTYTQFTTDVGGLLGSAGAPPVNNPNPGHTYSGSLTYTVSPTLVNDLTLAETWNSLDYYSTDNFASQSKSLIPGIPDLFPEPTAADDGKAGIWNGYQNIMANFAFSSLPNAMSFAGGGQGGGAYQNFDPIYTFLDNITTVKGGHTIKAGIYLEHDQKTQPHNDLYYGTYSFSSSTADPSVNTNDAYVNGLLGNVNSYQQASARDLWIISFTTPEYYVQDNWKVNRRLTFDLGVRLYQYAPQIENNNTLVNFFPSLYSQSAEARLYVPYCTVAIASGKSCPAVDSVARDPVSGSIVNSAYVGDFVPGSGDITSGSKWLGDGAMSLHQALFAAAPRLGFAYDLTGDGKTSLRGGWGVFYNRTQTHSDLSAQLLPTPPGIFTAQANYVSLPTLASLSQSTTNINDLYIAPTSSGSPTGSSTSSWPASNVPWERVQNASLNLQRRIGGNTVVELGYVINTDVNIQTSYDINALPIGSDWPFTGANASPVTANATLPSNLERKIFPGYGVINTYGTYGHINYNAAQFTLNRRLQHGLAWGATYTFSKALGATTYTPVVANNEEWNYGRLSTDRRNNLQISYNYDFPNIGAKTGLKGLALFADHWALSGIVSFISGAPYNPTCGLSSGATPDYTGTPDVSARCNVVGNPLANIGASGNGQVYFNPAAFALPAIANPSTNTVASPVLGNLGGGAGDLSLPHTTNFDMTMTKNIPLGSEKRVLKIQAQAYNVFNHTEISGIGTSIQFNPTTGLVNNGSSLGYVTGTLPARVLAFSIRLQF